MISSLLSLAVSRPVSSVCQRRTAEILASEGKWLTQEPRLHSNAAPAAEDCSARAVRPSEASHAPWHLPVERSNRQSCLSLSSVALEGCAPVLRARKGEHPRIQGVTLPLQPQPEPCLLLWCPAWGCLFSQEGPGSGLLQPGALVQVV